jgi:hypothetical protein
VAHTGKGKAWFDSLALDLDGEAYQDDSLFDLDFESAQTGFTLWGPGYGAASDESVFHTGKRSLRIEYGGTMPRPSFGVATSSFPVAVAAGKHVRFSGYIKTEGVVRGPAGLWWRVDGPNMRTLAFDNMQLRGATGTSDWTRYEINLPVSTEAININFGALLNVKEQPGSTRSKSNLMAYLTPQMKYSTSISNPTIRAVSFIRAAWVTEFSWTVRSFIPANKVSECGTGRLAVTTNRIGFLQAVRPQAFRPRKQRGSESASAAISKRKI